MIHPRARPIPVRHRDNHPFAGVSGTVSAPCPFRTTQRNRRPLLALNLIEWLAGFATPRSRSTTSAS